ncbi:uncharacterized protein [Nicotiana tomentosiformis]|uniref:uncharacterized protein n=1 Tax=Nicotiana tomentosiformis TaxID=4098 RepID=UPI00388C4451
MKKDIVAYVSRFLNYQQVKYKHQKLDGRTVRAHYSDIGGYVADMLYGFWGSWDQFLSLADSAYNNSYQLSIQMALYEALYGRRCRSPIGWFEPGEARLLGIDLVCEALEKVKVIQE